MTVMNIIEAVNSALHLEMARDERVVVLGEDVGKFGGVFRATKGLYEKFGFTLTDSHVDRSWGFEQVEERFDWRAPSDSPHPQT